MSSTIPPSRTQSTGAPPALPSEAPAERWNRIQEACDSLLIQNPDIEKNPVLAQSPADIVAPLGAIEKWTKTILDAHFQEQAPKGQGQAVTTAAATPTVVPTAVSSSASSPSPAPQTPRKTPANPAAAEPAFLSADPRMRAALHRLQEKTMDAAKNRLRPGSKLIRPGLEGFHQDALPVIESSDIKLNANDSKWRSPQEPTTRVLRSPGNAPSESNDH
jgi:hypothetical protein